MEPITLHVKTASGGKHTVTVSALTETIQAFKERLAPVVDIPAAAQRLIFRGHVLQNGQTFQAIKDAHALADGHTMHVVRAARAAPPPAPAPAATTTPAAGAGAAPTQNQNPNPAPGADPFSMFGGMGAGRGMPDMAEMQRTLMQNPEQMQAMMNSPMMDSLLNNPDVVRSMLLSNPQISELIERNPEVGHVLDDPATFRQMVQMARNPQLMNEMMRSTDRQLANIEAQPGGFNALRRMHETIQQPLMDATAGGMGGMGDDRPAAEADDNPFSSLFQRQNNAPSNAPMPNPWAPAPPTAPTAPAPNPAAGAATAAPGANAFAGLFQNPTQTAPGAGTGGGPGAGAGNPGAFPGFPGMPGLPGGMTEEQMLQMMESPFVQEMLADPSIMQAMIRSNPQLQQLFQQQPELEALMGNPEALQSMLSPSVLRSAMALRSAMTNTQGGGASAGTGTTGMPPAGTAPAGATPATAGTGAAAPGPAPGAMPAGFNMEQFAQMMNAMGGGPGAGAGAGGGGGVPPAPEPELTQEQLAPQLQQLRDMGFLDTTMCMQALRQARGNVALAVEHLLSRF